MTKKLRVAQDLNNQAVTNFKFQNIAGDSSSPVTGEAWLNTSSSLLKYNDGAADRTVLSTATIGATVQGYDATLAAVAGVSTAANKILYFTDTDVAGLLDLSTSTSLGTSDTTLATQNAVKSYIDAQIVVARNNYDVKDPVVTVATANIAVASAIINGATINGVTVATGERVLLTAQTDATQNGIYVVVASGAASRSTDADASSEVTTGLYTVALRGTYAGAAWVLSTEGTITLGSTNLAFTQITAAVNVTAGAGLALSGSTLSVNVDDSSIEINSDTLRVKAAGITNTMLAGSIADSKLSTITTANKVFGSAVQLGTNGGLSDSTGLIVNVDGTTITKPSGTLGVPSGGIGATQLATNAVTTVKITDANVTLAKLAAGAKTYVGTFITTDFSSGTLTIAQATHGFTAGKFTILAVEEDDATNYRNITDSVETYEVISSGDVKIVVTAGQEFNGRIKLMPHA